jgi:hypothetical protein
MQKLIILSDLWGRQKSDWIVHYTNILQDHFIIEYYNSCELAEINLTEYEEEKIHYQFINGGIEKAIKNLMAQEKVSVCVLGFSIGGYIAWKAAIEDFNVKSITAVSSTRLRNEEIKPKCEIDLIYGEDDSAKPKQEWFDKLELESKIYKGEKHDFYMKEENAINICKEIILRRKLLK